MNTMTGPQPLTPKEKTVLEFLEAYIGHHGLSPTYQEIKDHFGFASFNSVQRYLKQLETKSYIHVPGGNRKRAISLLESASSIQNSVKSMTESTIDNHKFSPPTFNNFNNSSLKGAQSAPMSESLSLPLLGGVAAGMPLEAMTDNEFVEVPTSFVKNASKSYALKVQGESMIEEGIHDGDVILVQEQSHAEQGEIAVAVVDNEATVKRFYMHKTDDGPISQPWHRNRVDSWL